jgi:hypothetical protein
MRILGTTTSHGFGSQYWLIPSGITPGYANALSNKNGNSYFSSYTSLTKLNEKGLVVWRKGVQAQVYGLKLDQNENIYSVGPANIYAVKYGKDGAVLWEKKYSPTTDTTQDIDLDLSGNAYIVGRDSSDRAQIIKIDSSGNLLWSRRAATTSEFLSVAYSQADNRVYAVGGFHFSSPSTSGVVAFDASNGNQLWAKQVSYGSINVFGFGISVDSLGYVYPAFTSQISVEPFNINTIYKLDSAGNTQWAKTVNNVRGAFAGTSVDGSDNIYFMLSLSGFIKIDALSNIVFQRSIGGTTLKGFAAQDGTYQMLGTSYGIKLNGDGSGLGVYGDFTYGLGTAILDNTSTSIGNSSISFSSPGYSAYDFSATITTADTPLDAIYIR